MPFDKFNNPYNPRYPGAPAPYSPNAVAYNPNAVAYNPNAAAYKP